MFLVAPPSPPPQHANACTGHNFVTNTPIKFTFAIAIEVPPRLQEPYDFWHQSEKQNGLWWPFCIKMLKKLVASLAVS